MKSGIIRYVTYFIFFKVGSIYIFNKISCMVFTTIFTWKCPNSLMVGFSGGSINTTSSFLYSLTFNFIWGSDLVEDTKRKVSLWEWQLGFSFCIRIKDWPKPFLLHYTSLSWSNFLRVSYEIVAKMPTIFLWEVRDEGLSHHNYWEENCILHYMMHVTLKSIVKS